MAEKDNLGCLDRIRNIYNTLKGAERKAAQYILENPNEIIHFSITELSDNSEVSETTIFRLCNRLGYKGYQDLKINLAGTIVEPIENIHEEIQESDDMYIVMHKILSSSVKSMENTMKLNKSEDIEKAVNHMLNADQLMFFGMGSSGPTAQDAYDKFIRTGMRCIVHTDLHWQAMFAAMAKENDVLIAFSNSGSDKELIDSIDIARKNGVKIISITGNTKSSVARFSDVVLLSYGKNTAFRSEDAESRLSTLILIDCLYTGLVLKKRGGTL